MSEDRLSEAPLIAIVEDDEFIGRFEAVDQVTVRSRVGGYLDQVHFKDGSIVKAGDLLAPSLPSLPPPRRREAVYNWDEEAP
jgi:multidrug efflux pump subunit AcrA (membrane-fusion protein)